MSETPVHVATIVGSTREGRFGDSVATWFVTRARQRTDLLIDVVDLADTGLPAVLPRHPSPEVIDYAERIDRTDAFVVVTPEYNHSFPAGLKQAIDLLHAPWQRKPVGFVSYGGVSGGLRAVEQLRLVFAELHATTVRETVSLHRAWERFDAEGELRDPGGAEVAVKAMLDELVWWATALRTARPSPFADDRWEE